MAEEKPRRVELELGLDPTPLEEGIQKAERELEDLQQAVQRLGMAAPPPPPLPLVQPAAVLPSQGIPPVPFVQGMPAPAQPPLLSVSATGEESVYGRVREDLQRIQARLLDDPRQNQARLEQLQGVLDEQVRQHPEQRDLYRELTQTIRDLTTTLKDAREKQAFQRFEQVLGIANLGQQLMGGNVLGTVGAALGTVLGGGMGSAVGATIGNALQSLINAAERPLQLRAEGVDVLARFGQTDEADLLLNRESGWLYQGRTNGYTAEETISQLEVGRQSGLIDRIDQTAVQVIREMQQLGRALGLTTEAVIELQGAYIRTGGQEGQAERMAQIAAAAVAAGYANQIEGYAELVNSARVQLVSGTANRIREDELVQQMLLGVLGRPGDIGTFYANNPHLLLAGLGGVWGLGATTDWGSTQAAFALQSGVRLEQLDPRFNRPEQLVENSYRVLQNSLGYLFGEDLPAAYQQARNNPEFVERYFADQPERQAAFNFVFGNPDPSKARILINLLQTMLENGGRLSDLPESNELMRRLADYNADPVATYRETMARRVDEMIKFFQNFTSIFLKLQELLTGIWEGVNTIISILPGNESNPRLVEQRLRTAITEARQAAEQGAGLGQIPVQNLQISREAWDQIRRLGGGEGIPSLEALSRGRTKEANLTLDEFVPVFERYLAAQGRPPLTSDLTASLPYPDLASRLSRDEQPPPPAPTPVTYAPTDFLAGGTDSLVARVVGYAEGTRTLDGGFTAAYQGHRDPGNGATNLGSFSYQHGASTPEEADRLQLQQMRTAWQVYEFTVQQYGYDPNDPRLALTFADLYTQSPAAAMGRHPNSFLEQIRTREPGLFITDDEILEMRKKAFRDPDTGASLHVFGERGGDADQERRHQAVLEALRHYQQQAANPSPTPASLPQLDPSLERLNRLLAQPKLSFSPALDKEQLALTPQSGTQLGSRLTTVNVYVQGSAATTLVEQVREAAYAGVKAAEDELDRDFARVDPGIYRNQPRYHPRVYN